VLCARSDRRSLWSAIGKPARPLIFIELPQRSYNSFHKRSKITSYITLRIQQSDNVGMVAKIFLICLFFLPADFISLLLAGMKQSQAGGLRNANRAVGVTYVSTMLICTLLGLTLLAAKFARSYVQAHAHLRTCILAHQSARPRNRKQSSRNARNDLNEHVSRNGPE